MFLPIYLFVVLTIVLIAIKSTTKFSRKRQCVINIATVGCIVAISFGDQLLIEFKAVSWTRGAINQNACQIDSGRIFTKFISIRNEQHCKILISSLRLGPEISARYVFINYLKFLKNTPIKDIEIDTLDVKSHYNISLNKSKNIDHCIEIFEQIHEAEYSTDSAKNQLGEMINKSNECLLTRRIEDFSENYRHTYEEVEESILFVDSIKYTSRKLLKIDTNDVLYDKRLAYSTGGWFFKWVLANPDVGSLAHVLNVGSTL